MQIADVHQSMANVTNDRFKWQARTRRLQQTHDGESRRYGVSAIDGGTTGEAPNTPVFTERYHGFE